MPQTHTVNAIDDDDNLHGKALVTIFVLDLLNSSFEDFAFIRYARYARILRRNLRCWLRPPR